MASIRIKLIADLGPFLNVMRYAEKNKPLLLSTAADRYLKYQKDRFLRLSRGGGEWPSLKKATIARKKRRGVAKNPSLILREKNELFKSLGRKTVKNQIWVGFVQNRSHWRARGTTFLAKIHHTGAGVVPERKVIGRPTQHVRRAMVQDVRDKYRQVIARQRKKK